LAGSQFLPCDAMLARCATALCLSVYRSIQNNWQFYQDG